MPYFNTTNTNLLFIHIPKTGGSSLEYYFSAKYKIPLNAKSLHMFLDDTTNIVINSSLQHMTYQTIIKYKKEFGINMDNLKIITIVRNPYERLISDLFFFNKIKENDTNDKVHKIIQTYLYETKIDNHNIPQYHFITDENENIIPNIYILKTETLTKDMHNLGYTDFNNFANKNKNKNNLNYFNYLNNDSIKLINDFYTKDFELFGYSKIIV